MNSYESLKKRYGSLMKRYGRLSQKYDFYRKNPRFLGHEISKRLVPQSALLFSAVAGACLYMMYAHWIMIEIGFICFFADLAQELYGTGKGWWSYKKSVFFDIKGRVPIDIPVTFFFLGMMFAGILLFLIGY